MVTEGRNALRAIPALLMIMSMRGVFASDSDVGKKWVMVEVIRVEGPAGEERSAEMATARMVCCEERVVARTLAAEADDGEV